METKSIIKQTVLNLAVAISIAAGAANAGSWTTENGLAGMDSVHIYKPTTTPALTDKRALMINLHGCYQSNTDFKNNGGWEETADVYGMVIAIPDVPGMGALYGSCWDYYGSSHTRTNKHNKNIIEMTENLIARSELNIDHNQVYITGFPSGGGQVNAILCLAPDIFAGGGASAGPSVGTTSNDAQPPYNFSVANAAITCRSLAGDNASYLDTQLYSTIHGTNDSVIGFGYNSHNAEIMNSIYSANIESTAAIDSDGTEVVWSDSSGPRVSKISVAGMDHDWAAKNGGSNNHFVNNKVDYPAHVTQFFFENNRRIELCDNCPDLSASVILDGDIILISGTAEAYDNSSLIVDVSISFEEEIIFSDSTQTDSENGFEFSANASSFGNYKVIITTTDSAGNSASVNKNINKTDSSQEEPDPECKFLCGIPGFNFDFGSIPWFPSWLF